jgi:uncharacterized protein YdeI (YjbR/CyaY-like superfamily)
VQESLHLDKKEWIQEFGTRQKSFLLDIRPDVKLVGVLLVSKPTEILRNALAKLMDDLSYLWVKEELIETTRIPEELQAKFEELLKISFPFIPPSD